MKSSYIRGDQTIRKNDFMPTTNISQTNIGYHRFSSLPNYLLRLLALAGYSVPGTRRRSKG